MTCSGRPDDQFHIERWFQGEAVVVRAAGEVDLATAPLLSTHLGAAAAQVTPPAPVVADLSGVSFFSSNGVAVLLDVRQQCRQQNIAFRIVATRPVIRPLDALGMQHMFSVSPTLSAALGVSH